MKSTEAVDDGYLETKSHLDSWVILYMNAAMSWARPSNTHYSHVSIDEESDGVEPRAKPSEAKGSFSSATTGVHQHKR